MKKTLITSVFYWLVGGGSGQNIYRWELQYRLHRTLHFFESTRTHFCQQLEITFFETIIWDKILIYLFKSRSNILYKILCIHSIKMGLVLQKTCRYKEITCGVPQGSVLGPISYHHLVQISGQYMTFCKRNIFANHRIV